MTGKSKQSLPDPSVRRAHILQRLSAIPEGREIVGFLKKNKVKIGFYTKGVNYAAASWTIKKLAKGKYHYKNFEIKLNAHLSDDNLIQALIHEARHIRQHSAGVGNPDFLPGRRGHCLLRRVQEADAQAQTTHIVHKLKLSGDSGPYNEVMKTIFAPMLVAYEDACAENAANADNGFAMRAAFDAWFENAHNRQHYDQDTLAHHIPMIERLVKGNEKGHGLLPVQMNHEWLTQIGGLSPVNYLDLSGYKALTSDTYLAEIEEHIKKYDRMVMKENDLTETFKVVSAILPDITEGAKAYGKGGFGLVLKHDDDTLTKVILRPDDNARYEIAKQGLEKEISALRFFENNPIEGVQIPRIIDEPVLIDDENIIGYFRMSKLPGQTLYDIWSNQYDTQRLKDIYRSSGKVLAKFHEAAKGMDFAQHASRHGHEIQHVPQLDDAANKALRLVDQFLKANLHGGGVHGDYNGSNIFVEKSQVTGLIDFSFSGRSPNIFSDFWAVYPAFQDEFIEGYAEQSGREADKDIVSATKVALWVQYMNSIGQDENRTNYALRKINEELFRLSHITNYKPTEMAGGMKAATP